MKLIEVYDNAILDDAIAGADTQYDTAKAALLVTLNTMTAGDVDPDLEVTISRELDSNTYFVCTVNIVFLGKNPSRSGTMYFRAADAAYVQLADLSDATGYTMTNETVFRELLKNIT